MIIDDHISEVVLLHHASVAPRSSVCERNGPRSLDVLRAIRRPSSWTAIERRHNVADYPLQKTYLQDDCL
jgi:hypothetical protein